MAPRPFLPETVPGQVGPPPKEMSAGTVNGIVGGVLGFVVVLSVWYLIKRHIRHIEWEYREFFGVSREQYRRIAVTALALAPLARSGKLDQVFKDLEANVAAGKLDARKTKSDDAESVLESVASSSISDSPSSSSPFIVAPTAPQLPPLQLDSDPGLDLNLELEFLGAKPIPIRKLPALPALPAEEEAKSESGR